MRSTRCSGCSGLALVDLRRGRGRGFAGLVARGRGFVPRLPDEHMPGVAVYAYFVVGLFSAILMPYEVHFYSSGAIEEKWTPKDLPSNFINAVVGFALGGLLTIALVMVGAQAYFGTGSSRTCSERPRRPLRPPSATTARDRAHRHALRDCRCAARRQRSRAATASRNSSSGRGARTASLRDAPLFHGTWAARSSVGLAISLTGVQPLSLVQYSVIFAVVVLPFTYWPILRVADDRKLMGQHVNGPRPAGSAGSSWHSSCVAASRPCR